MIWYYLANCSFTGNTGSCWILNIAVPTRIGTYREDRLSLWWKRKAVRQAESRVQKALPLTTGRNSDMPSHHKASKTQCCGPAFGQSRNRGSRTASIHSNKQRATRTPAHSVTTQESPSYRAGARC